MASSDNQLGTEWEDVLEYYSDEEVQESYRLLSEYAPDVLDGYIVLRRATAKLPPVGVLSPKVKELVILGMECMARRPAIFHARKAVEIGATLPEIAEVLSLCIAIGGMITYQDSGRLILKEAEKRFEELSR